MKKNIPFEQLLKEIASESIARRILEEPQRLAQEDLTRLLPEHIAVIVRRHPELRGQFF